MHLSTAAPLGLLILAMTACKDDPDDTGETGDPEVPAGESSWTSSAHPGCGVPTSVTWLRDPTGKSTNMLMYASTVPDLCATLLASEALIEAEWEAAYDLIRQALAEGDYAAACQASLTWEQRYQPYNDAMLPAGSCTLALLTRDSAPGSYETAGAEAGMVTLLQVQADVGAAIVAAFDGCEGVVDEQSWEARQAAVDEAQWQAAPYWVSTAGAVVLEAEDGEILRASGNDLSTEDTLGSSTGTLSFDLHATLCGE